MARPRVTASMRKQLTELRSARSNLRRGGVMRVPRIMCVDEWEALASAQQDALIEASYEDRADRSKRNPEPVVIGPDPADASHCYKSSTVR